ncbi:CARBOXYMETHYLENEBUTENOLIDASE HOMOLOG [Ceraceosorus bombacis]|uniref:CARBOXYMETHYLENEBUTENOLIDASE HOMOLOG n=1 Tax=Ceraceosorus bombacis TaxID=401625 RepID=A0A0P1B9Y3_9BASI|nr:CARBOXYMETHYLENEBUTENOLIDASE HOMOLOG [Ceraceosorus bombacis]
MRFHFSDKAFDFEALRAASYSHSGGGDVGEVLAICGKVKSGSRWLGGEGADAHHRGRGRGSSGKAEERWREAFELAALRAEALARRSLSAQNDLDAKLAFLRASNYARTADFFLRDKLSRGLQDADSDRLYQQSVDCFLSAMQLDKRYTYRKLAIPYTYTIKQTRSRPQEKQTCTLPGYLITHASKDANANVDANANDNAATATAIARPTIILNGGYDGTKEEAYLALGHSALARGYNFLTFDGPGQGAALRKLGLTFRSDWEAVVDSVLDHVHQLDLPQIDTNQLVLYGWSMGGYLAARAAAFDAQRQDGPRIAALILNDGVYDFGSSFTKNVPWPANRIFPDPRWDRLFDWLAWPAAAFDTGIRWGQQNGLWTLGAKSASDLLRKISHYHLRNGLAELISHPTLILDAEDDHFMKGQPDEL